jgi:hypothetical protein
MVKSDISLEEEQLKIVQSSYASGLRAANLDNQPAPWIKRGLEILEVGGKFTVEKIKSINLSGGTDHPDPWFK